MNRATWYVRAVLLIIMVGLSGRLEFASIEQPSCVSPGELFTVRITVTPGDTGFPAGPGAPPYFGLCIPRGWTVPGGAFSYTGACQGTIRYDPNLSLDQENLSPAPKDYYWWVGEANSATTGDSPVSAEVPIQTGLQTGRYSLDYLLVVAPDISWEDSGLPNARRSNHHIIDVVNEFTPRALRAVAQRNTVVLSWLPPLTSQGLAAYGVYREGQLICAAPAQTTEVLDGDLAAGVFHYSVCAVYAKGDEQSTPYEVEVRVLSAGPEVAHVVTQVRLDSYRAYLQDDLYAHAGDERLFGPQHDWARQNVQKRFESFGLSTRLDPFVYNGAQHFNVVGVLPGVTRPEETYLVGAHHDTVSGSPGACDNAAGVAGVLEAARVLSQYHFDATLVFIAFDREEQGLKGSQAYASQHAQDNIRAVIALDVIAYRPYAPTQQQYHQASLCYQSVRPEFVNGLAEALGAYGELTSEIARNPGGWGSDYIPFDHKGLPAVMINAYSVPTSAIHTSLDSLDNPGYIDYDYGVQITRSLVGYLAAQAGLRPVHAASDVRGGWGVDTQDLTLLMEHWGQADPDFDIAPPPAGDGLVDNRDLEGLMHYWGQEIPDPGFPVRWKVDKTAGTILAVVDDFESYTDEMAAGQAIFQTWLNGVGWGRRPRRVLQLR